MVDAILVLLSRLPLYAFHTCVILSPLLLVLADAGDLVPMTMLAFIATYTLFPMKMCGIKVTSLAEIVTQAYCHGTRAWFDKRLMLQSLQARHRHRKSLSHGGSPLAVRSEA